MLGPSSSYESSQAQISCNRELGSMCLCQMKYIFPGIEIPIIKKIQSWDCLTIIIGIHVMERLPFYIWSAPLILFQYKEHFYISITKIPDSKFMRPAWGPPGTCRPQMGPMLAPWTLLSGIRWLWDVLFSYNRNCAGKMVSWYWNSLQVSAQVGNAHDRYNSWDTNSTLQPYVRSGVGGRVWGVIISV